MDWPRAYRAIGRGYVAAATLTCAVLCCPDGANAGAPPATPAINTSQQPASALVGSSIADQATVSGGNNPTGTVTFDLYANPTGTGTPLFTDANVAMAGGTATSIGYTASVTGVDYWVATYNGDANNNSVTSGTALEPVVVSAVTPNINTAQQPASVTIGGSIADRATVSGGFNPSGTVTFGLYNNAIGVGTPLFTDANVPLIGGTANSAGYTATATGTDYWVTTYNGDADNNAVTSGTALEPVTVGAATPSLSTVPGGTVILGTEVPLTDSATLTGGFNPTGTITFELFGNATGTGTPLFTDTEPLGGGTANSQGYLPLATGTDDWVATYNGDSSNNSVTGGTADEPETVAAAQPAPEPASVALLAVGLIGLVPAKARARRRRAQ